MRERLAQALVPDRWREMRARLELFKDLREEHTAWVPRIHAILLHQGAPAIAGDLLGAHNRRQLESGEQLSEAAGRRWSPRCGSWMRWMPSLCRCGGRSPRRSCRSVSPHQRYT